MLFINKLEYSIDVINSLVYKHSYSSSSSSSPKPLQTFNVILSILLVKKIELLIQVFLIFAVYISFVPLVKYFILLNEFILELHISMFLKIGISSILGGLFLATAFTGFIFSITMTSAAVTLFMLAAMPFIAAIVGYFVLGEILKRSTLVAMIVAFIGV